jgi:hypothetical protein
MARLSQPDLDQISKVPVVQTLAKSARLECFLAKSNGERYSVCSTCLEALRIPLKCLLHSPRSKGIPRVAFGVPGCCLLQTWHSSFSGVSRHSVLFVKSVGLENCKVYEYGEIGLMCLLPGFSTRSSDPWLLCRSFSAI